MLKILLKKQILESLAALTKRGTNKKKKSKNTNLLLYAVLLVYLCGLFGLLFYQMMDTLCEPLVNANLTWLYFALAGTAATALGIIGSVFAAQHQLFEAKDNEFLLSMPVSPSKLLLSRMLVLYIESFAFEAVVFIPAIIRWIQTSDISVLGIIFAFAILFVLPLFALTLSCILGWLVAIISSRMRNKSLITIVLSLLLFAVYYYIYFKINDLLQLILVNAEEVGRSVKIALYPLYHMGNAMTGNVASFVIFLAIIIAAFAITCCVLAITFLKVALTKRSVQKIKYREKTLKVSNIRNALFKRELSRISKNPTYMLNCAMGTFFLVLGTLFLIIKSSTIRDFITGMPFLSEFLPAIACLAICFIASMNMLTTPSISIEGKNLWILQSFPISGWSVLKSKLNLHIILTGIPSLLASAVICATFSFSPLMSVLLFLTPFIFIILTAAAGLLINLRFPMLDWSNETIAVKQSSSLLLSMLFNWTLLGLTIGLYFAVSDYISTGTYVLTVTIIWALLAFLLVYKLKTKGTEKFAAL